MRTVPYVPQMEVAECGIACLAMVLGFYGRHVPLFELRERSGVGRDGTDAARLLILAREEGLTANGARVGMARLRRGGLFPCVLHWKLDHFVVAERATRGGLVIVDPNAGRRTVPWRDVDRDFSGICLLFKRGPEFSPRARKRLGLRTWLEPLVPMLPVIGLMLVMGFAFDLLAFAFPAVTSAFVDYVMPAHSRTMLAALVAGIALLALMRTAFVAVRLRVLQGVEAEISRRLGQTLFGGLIRLEVPFFAKRSPGDLAFRVQAALTLRETVLVVTQSLFDLALMGVYFALLFAYDVGLASILTVLVALRIGFGVRATRRLADHAAAEAVARSEVGDVFVESFGNAEAVKALRLEPHFLAKLDRARGRELAAFASASESAATHTAILTVLEQITLAAVLVVGGRSIASGAMTIGAFASFLAVESLVTGRTASMALLVTELARLGPTLDRLDDIRCAPVDRSCTPVPTAAPSALEIAPLGERRTDVELREVSFAFQTGGRRYLDGVSLSLRRGEHVAIVGRSGSGKSTILRLAAGLLRPTSGAVTIFGAPTDGPQMATLRERVAFVPALGQIFDGTALDNVALDSGASAEEVRAALEAMRLDEVFARRRDGVLTELSRERTTLSAGQCQRLLLARALVRRPELLLLDEATSALDEALELEIIGELQRADATIISATHRPAVMKAADRILVVEGGRIVEEGSFNELQARSARFAEVVA